MKVFIIVASTADGFIAKNEDHPAIWTSKEDKKHFVELTKQAGVIVMGSKTFKTLPKPLKDRHNIIYSKTKIFEGAEVTNKDPLSLIKDLENRGYNEVAICGGRGIYSMFLKSGVVDTIYLTIEPVIFGSGINIFDFPSEHKLITKNIRHTDAGTIFVEYQIIKN
jgi:dihydrofolate reductase